MNIGTIKYPKTVDIIKICGCIKIAINEEVKDFKKPTEEQIKNMREMLGIDVVLMEESEETERLEC